MREWREGGDPEQSHQDEDPWQNRRREESGAQPTEVEVGEVETPAEPRRQRPRMTPLDWRAKAEPLVHGIWVKPVGVRTMVELEARRQSRAEPEEECLMGPAKAGPRSLKA